jgi:hypothetical protein
MKPNTDHVPTLPVGAQHVQARDFELMAEFARSHNGVCPKALPWSEENNTQYCRYHLHTQDSSIGQCYYLRCQECGEAYRCDADLNV